MRTAAMTSIAQRLGARIPLRGNRARHALSSLMHYSVTLRRAEDTDSKLATPHVARVRHCRVLVCRCAALEGVGIACAAQM